MLCVGEDEEKLGMADVRERGGKKIGKLRINKIVDLFKGEEPAKATKEIERYENMWSDESYPFDENLYTELMEKDRLRQEEEKKRAILAKEASEKKIADKKKKEAEKAAARKVEKERKKKEFEEKRKKEAEQKKAEEEGKKEEAPQES